MVPGGVTEEAVRNLNKTEETEVWAQARVSVSRAAVTKYCKLGDIKTAEVYRLPVLGAPSSKSRCWQGCALLKALVENPFLQPLVFTGLPWCSLTSSCSTVISESDVTWALSPCQSGSHKDISHMDVGSPYSRVTSS